MPILKWKQGELQALEHVAAVTRSLIAPMIDIVEDSIDIDQESLASPPFQRSASKLARAWPSGPIFVDADEYDLQLASGANPVSDLFTALRVAGVHAVPVVRLGCSAAYTTTVAAIVHADRRGCALRLTIDDLASPSLAAGVAQTLAAVAVQPFDTDLVLDFGAIEIAAASATYLAAASVLPLLPTVMAWRSITFAGSSFPETLSAAGVGFSTITRAEWNVYQLLLFNLGTFRPVSFGDYAIAHPVYRQVGFPGSAAIRYAQQNDWLINRGRSVNGPVHGGYGQFRTLSAQLVALQAYCGAGHCWACQYISTCAQGGGPGSNTTWRAVGTNHHITFVADQCASYRVPSTGIAPPLVGP
jgi:hypothetical protein